MVKRIGDADGRGALARARDGGGRQDVATAVRWTLQALTDRAPGKSVEVRVPPFGAVQCIEGPGHTRGTPPNVVEMDPEVWLAIATGERSWDDARGAGQIRASGTRADLSAFVPVVRVEDAGNSSAERGRLQS